MSRIIRYSLLFILVAVFISCEATVSDNETEKVAIIKVIEDETIYFMTRDVEKWKASWHQVPYTFTNWTLLYEPGDVVVTRGFDELVNTVTTYWSTSESKGIQPYENLDYQIEIRGHVAWVNFTQRTEGYGHVLNSYETRILEKVNGKWLIIGVNTATDFKDADPPIPCNY